MSYEAFVFQKYVKHLYSFINVKFASFVPFNEIIYSPEFKDDTLILTLFEPSKFWR